MDYRYFITFAPVIAFGFVLLIFGIGALIDFFANRPAALEKLDHPAIAYKRAMLLPPTLVKREHDFQGVVGQSYGAVDRATSSLGFHAYEDFKRARKHPQTGNVFLEVALSGNVQEHDLGWTASEQRVLQVIPHCSFSITGHVCRSRPTKYFTVQGQLYFHCTFHSVLGRIVALAYLAPIEPVSGLAARYENFEKHNVLVAFESGADRFIPTELQSGSEIKS